MIFNSAVFENEDFAKQLGRDKRRSKIDVDSVDRVDQCQPAGKVQWFMLTRENCTVVDFDQLEKCSLTMSTKKNAAVDVEGNVDQ